MDPGEERDEVIRTSEEIRLIYCYTLLMVWLSELYKQKVCSALHACLCERECVDY